MSLILRVVPLPEIRLFRPHAYPDSCANFTRAVLGFTRRRAMQGISDREYATVITVLQRMVDNLEYAILYYVKRQATRVTRRFAYAGGEMASRRPVSVAFLRLSHLRLLRVWRPG